MTTGRGRQTRPREGGGAFATLSTSYRVHWQPAERVDQRSTSALPLPFRAPREIARRALKQKCCPLRGNGFLICCARWEVLRERHENERARVHFLLKFTLPGEQMNRSKNSFSLSISRETPPAHGHPRLVRLGFIFRSPSAKRPLLTQSSEG